MPGFNLNQLISDIAPDALCYECIRDRVPLAQRGLTQILMNNLRSPTFEQSRDECVACRQMKQVIRHV
jgi:hypothetical protein